MRLLLDTHAALWWFSDDRRLSATARRAIAKPDTVRLLSIASAWELTIKSSLGKLRLPLPAGRFLEEHLPINRIELLAIQILVRAATDVFRIVNQVRDPGDLADQGQEFPVAHKPVKLSARWTDSRDIGHNCLTPSLSQLVHGLSHIESGRLRHQPLAERRNQNRNRRRVGH